MVVFFVFFNLEVSEEVQCEVSRQDDRAEEAQQVEVPTIRITLIRLASGVALHEGDPAHTPRDAEDSGRNWVPEAGEDVEDNEGGVGLKCVLVATLDAVEVLLGGIGGVHVGVGDLVFLASSHDLATEVLEGDEGSDLTEDHVAKLSGDFEASHGWMRSGRRRGIW